MLVGLTLVIDSPAVADVDAPVRGGGRSAEQVVGGGGLRRVDPDRGDAGGDEPGEGHHLALVALSIDGHGAQLRVAL